MSFKIRGDIKEFNIITEKVNELKQHINLSKKAMETIYLDIDNFCPTDNKFSISKFLNLLFKNYYSKANASLSLKLIEEEEKIFSFLSKDIKNIDKKNNPYIKSFINNKIREIKKITNSYEKGIGFKIRLNKDSLDILRESKENLYYYDNHEKNKLEKNGNIGKYLKAVFEEYAKKPIHVREKIFFADTIDRIELAINKHNVIKIEINEGTNKRFFYVQPYKIIVDEILNYNYLVGFSKENEKNILKEEKDFVSFRISRIEKVSLLTSFTYSYPKKITIFLEKMILEKKVPFLAGELKKIRVIFSNKGLTFLKKQLYMKPIISEKLSENEFTFICTEIQAINYFFKFGKHAKIVEPINLSKLFKKRYIEAFKIYNNEENLTLL